MANTSAIHAGLERVFHGTPAESLPLANARYIIFSDQHRGQRDGADDFVRSEATYLAALASYDARGFTLIMLGDAEELWECRPEKALPAYANVAVVERAFNAAGRYVRVFGNHDDRWMDDTEVERHLVPRFGPVQVREALRWRLTLGGRQLGELFLVHGHQGTWGSDKNRKLSRWVVRNIWRPLQKLIPIRLTTPAKDECLRERHDVAMYEWTLAHPGVALVAGHTHRPVWTSRTHVQQMEEELARLRKNGASATEIAALEQAIAARRKKDKYCDKEHRKRHLDPRPSYFNSGCCCFEDGNVTGIEIEGDQIRLVKWEGGGGGGQPRRLELATAALPSVFDQLR